MTSPQIFEGEEGKALKLDSINVLTARQGAKMAPNGGNQVIVIRGDYSNTSTHNIFRMYIAVEFRI